MPGTRQVPLFFGPAADQRPGTLTERPALFAGRQTFTDDPAQTAEQLTDDEQAADPNRLAFLTTPLDRATRLSGTPRVTVRASLDGSSPYLTALLVDYGPGERFAGLRRLDEVDCVGPGVPEDPGCFARREYVTARTPYQIVSRGWLDVRNRGSAGITEPIEPGRAYTFGWQLQPQDHVFAAGNRIGLVLVSTDRDFTLRYRAGTTVTTRLGLSNVTLPLSGQVPAPR
jgi:X-Pro dipeptidyl-peptidase